MEFLGRLLQLFALVLRTLGALPPFSLLLAARGSRPPPPTSPSPPPPAAPSSSSSPTHPGTPNTPEGETNPPRREPALPRHLREPKKPKIFAEDTVVPVSCEKDWAPLEVSLVVRASYETDSEAEEEQEVEEGQEPKVKLQDGQVRITNLSSGKVDVVDEDSLRVLDRSFLYADAVTRKGSTTRMSGTVVNVNITCDIIPAQFLMQSRSDPDALERALVRGISTRKMQDARLFMQDDLVVYKGCLGRVDDVYEDVEFTFPDGSRCLVDIEEKQGASYADAPASFEGAQLNYCPGLRIKGTKSFWMRATWTKGKLRGERIATVSRIIPHELAITWEPNCPEILPSSIVDKEIKQLTRLDLFAHARTQLGDFVLVPAALVPEEMRVTGRLNYAMVARTSTKVDVLWQDGTYERDIPSLDLVLRLSVDDHDFWPTDFVSPAGENAVASCGQVQKMDAEQRTCLVEWLDAKDGPFVEEVSVYDLKDHPDFVYQLGNPVYRALAFDYSECNLDEGLVDRARRLVSLISSIATPEHEKGEGADQPVIGQIAGCLPHGYVVVVWITNKFSVMRPESLALINTEFEYNEEGEEAEEDLYIDSSGEEDGEEQGEESDGWETMDDESGGEEGEEGSGGEEVGSEEEGEGMEVVDRHPEQGAHLILPELPALRGGIVPPEDDRAENPLGLASWAQEASKATAQPAQHLSIVPSERLLRLSADTKLEWSNFEVISEDPQDNHFYGESFQAPQSSFMRVVRAEHSLLSQGLPPGIFVKTYESRMDLFRILILPSDDTPYQGAMFFFDARLPPEYPKVPPTFFFYSWTDSLGRLNPNLYEEGKICLSLLGTWEGKGSENWNPATSNMLQVLISIQGLVLVKEPYYNEAGFEKQVGFFEGSLNSVLYNERAFVLTTRSIAWSLRHPPSGFEEEIFDYYLRQGQLSKVIERRERLILHGPVSSSPSPSEGDKAEREGEGEGEVVDHFFKRGTSKGCLLALKNPLAQLNALKEAFHAK